MSACIVEDCDKSLRKGRSDVLCSMHRARVARYGRLNLVRQQYHANCCSVEGCNRKFYAKGLCQKHWQKERLANNSVLREQAVERARAWAASNPERTRQTKNRNSRERYARLSLNERRAFWRNKIEKRKAPGWTKESAQYVDLVLGEPCSYFWLCGNLSDTIDHITPIHSEGTAAWDNLASLCRSCNSSKGTDSLLLFMLRRLESV